MGTTGLSHRCPRGKNLVQGSVLITCIKQRSPWHSVPLAVSADDSNLTLGTRAPQEGQGPSTTIELYFDWLRHYRYIRYAKLCHSCRNIQHTKIWKTLELDIWSCLLLWWSWFEAVRYKVCPNLVQSVFVIFIDYFERDAWLKVRKKSRYLVHRNLLWQWQWN